MIEALVLVVFLGAGAFMYRFLVYNKIVRDIQRCPYIEPRAGHRIDGIWE